jgi:RNA polymerase sigma-70 factor (ECF subfamily)
MPTGLEAVLTGPGPAAASVAPGLAPDRLDAVVTRILAGDLEAFGELMALTETKVLAVAWRLLGEREQARDAAQEVYLRVHRSLASYRLGENFNAWICRITVNVCNDHARRRGPAMAGVEALDGPVHADPGSGAEEAVLLRERRALLQSALAGLTPAERSALVLRDLEGLSTEDTARALGVRPVTIRSQLCSARSKLQAFCSGLLRPSQGGRP